MPKVHLFCVWLKTNIDVFVVWLLVIAAVARSVIRAWDEEVYNQMDFSHDESEEAVRARAERKRGTFDGILDQVQLCSPIISLGIQLIEEAGVNNINIIVIFISTN